MVTLLRRWTLLLSVVTFVASTVAASGGVWYPGALVSSFIPHIGGAAVVATLLLLGFRYWKLAAVGGLIVILFALPALRWHFPARGPGPSPDAEQVSILVANVLSPNRQHDAFIELVREESPDVLLVIELGIEWADALKAIEDEYPYSWTDPASNNFGFGIYSKLPFAEPTMQTPENARIPVVSTELDMEQGPMPLVVAHPLPPVSPMHWRARNAYLHWVAAHAAAPDVIVAGDLNTTETDVAFRRLLRDSGLRDTRAGYGRQPTWPGPMAWLGLTLDHVLVGERWHVSDRRTGPIDGSDHWWVRVALAIDRPSE